MNFALIYRVAATAVACVLGAGFVSGQELWQYFGSYGTVGILGAGIAVLLFCLAAATVLWFAGETGEGTMEGLISPKKNPIVKWLVIGFECSMHYILYILMAAATGALGERFGLPVWVGSVFFCVLCTTVSMFGIKGLMKVFGWMVPILTVAAVAVAAFSLTLPEDAIPIANATASPLTGNWWISSLNYFCFNFVGSVPILVAAAHSVKGQRGIGIGALLAALPLGGLAIFLLIAVMIHPGAAAYELPMMELAAACGPVWEYTYAILLLGGVFATGFSSQGALNNYIMGMGVKNKTVLLVVSVILSVVAFLIALLGFKDLVGLLYPILGYIGIIPITAIFLRAGICFVKKRRRQE